MDGIGIAMWCAVEENHSDARFVKNVDCRIGVLGCGVVVAPVHECSCTAVYLVESASEITDVDVIGIVSWGDLAVNAVQVLRQRPIGAHQVQRSLPGVQVSVDQAGNDRE
jgi:hypothetical protein